MKLKRIKTTCKFNRSMMVCLWTVRRENYPSRCRDNFLSWHIVYLLLDEPKLTCCLLPGRCGPPQRPHPHGLRPKLVLRKSVDLTLLSNNPHQPLSCRGGVSVRPLPPAWGLPWSYCVGVPCQLVWCRYTHSADRSLTPFTSPSSLVPYRVTRQHDQPAWDYRQTCYLAYIAPVTNCCRKSGLLHGRRQLLRITLTAFVG